MQIILLIHVNGQYTDRTSVLTSNTSDPAGQ